MVKTGQAVISVGILAGILLLVVGLVPIAYGQQAVPPDFLFTLTESLRKIDNRPITRDDLRDVPAPRVDKLSEAVRTTGILSDPRCLPGEDGFGPERLGRRPARPVRSR